MRSQQMSDVRLSGLIAYAIPDSKVLTPGPVNPTSQAIGPPISITRFL